MAELKQAGTLVMKNENLDLPSEPIFFVDTEGNGHSPQDLIEISILKFNLESNKKDDIQNWLIKPPNPIKRVVTKIHGLKNADVENCPVWEEIKDEVHSHLSGAWLIAHNAIVDYNIIKTHIPEWEPAGVIDTMKLAKHFLPEATSYSLENLINYKKLHFNKSKSFHRASYDAQATSKLFNYLLSKSDFRNWNEICQVCQVNISKKNKPIAPQQGELW